MICESEVLLVNKLPIEPGAGFEDVALITFGPVPAGTDVLVYAEAHGDPRQPKDVEECAWVTGVSVYDEEGVAVSHPCQYGGNDLERARKTKDSRIGAFTTLEDREHLTAIYRMRAVNLKAGGEFRITWAKIGVKYEPV